DTGRRSVRIDESLKNGRHRPALSIKKKARRHLLEPLFHWPSTAASNNYEGRWPRPMGCTNLEALGKRKPRRIGWGFLRSRAARSRCRYSLRRPSPPAEQASASKDQTGKASDDGAGDVGDVVSSLERSVLSMCWYSER